MSIYQYQGVVTALTSISHIGETRGITSLLRREKVINAAGDGVEDVPIISGNSMRGRLRDIGMAHMCRSIGYEVFEDSEGEFKVRGLSIAAHHFLFSGGSLSKEAGKALDIDLARKYRSVIPLISIFGSAVGNMMLDGKMAECGKLYPICLEVAHLLPEQYANKATFSFWNMIQRESNTRRDDTKNEFLRLFLDPGERKQLEAQNALKREKQKVGNDVDTEIGKHQQMRYHHETFAAGTRFFAEFILKEPTDVEYEAFMITLAEFSRLPFIGGRSAVGHGKIKMKFENWTEINPNLALTATEVDRPIGTKYVDHLQKNGASIKDMLAKIS